jgi:hypothetical protein
MSKFLLAVALIACAPRAILAVFEPPTCSIRPASSTTAELVTITLMGEWPNVCGPDHFDLEIIGDVVWINVKEMGACIQIVGTTPWWHSFTVGPLMPDAYTVFVTYNWFSSYPPPLPPHILPPPNYGWPTCGFTVTDVSSVVVDADFDNDDDVDAEDFGHLQACLTGTNLGPPLYGCADADLDHDGDADIDDVTAFQSCLSGPGVQAGANCAQ